MMQIVSSHRAAMLILSMFLVGCGRRAKERANDLYVAARKAEAAQDWVLAYKGYKDIVDNYSTTDTAVMVMRESTLGRIRPLAERQTKERRAREAFVSRATARSLSEAQFVRTLLKEAQQFQAEGDLEQATDRYEFLANSFSPVDPEAVRQAELAVPELKGLLALVSKKMESIRLVLQEAETARKDRKYVRAKQLYMEAKREAQSCYELARDRRIQQLIDVATKALVTDEVRLGSQGYVFCAGKWMTKEDQLAAEMAKQGKKLYKGEWLTQAAIEKLKQAESAKGTAPAIEKPVGKTTQSADLPADPNAEIWMLDDFESSKITWGIASWGNKGTMSLLKVGKNTVLKIDYTKRAGDENKFVIQKRIPKSWALSTRDQVVFDLENRGKAPFQLAVAFQTRDWEWFYESPGYYIRTGDNKDLMVDLRAKRFKCKDSGWANTSELKRMDEFGFMLIIIYPRESATVTLDNVRFVRLREP